MANGTTQSEIKRKLLTAAYAGFGSLWLTAAVRGDATWTQTASSPIPSFNDAANWTANPASTVDVFANNYSGSVTFSGPITVSSIAFRNTSNAITLDLQANTVSFPTAASVAMIAVGTASGHLNDVTIQNGTLTQTVTTGRAMTLGANGSHGNKLTLTGANTLVSAPTAASSSANATLIGTVGSNDNVLSIVNGARVNSFATWFLGNTAATTPGTGNKLIVQDATLTFGASRGLTLFGSNNSVTINNGVVANGIGAANAGTIFNFNSGFMSSRGLTFSTGSTITIGDGGATPANFVLIGSAGTAVFSQGVVLNSNAVLTTQAGGNTLLTGNVSGIAGAKISPGDTALPAALGVTGAQDFLTINVSGTLTNANITEVMNIGNLTSSVIAGNTASSGTPSLQSDRLTASTFAHGGTVSIDLSKYIPPQDAAYEVKVLGWSNQTGTPADTAVQFINNNSVVLPFERRSDGLYVTAQPITADSTWNIDADNSWVSTASWTGATPVGTRNLIPYGVGATANFGSIITAPRIVTLNSQSAAISLGTMNFSSLQGYTISGSGQLNLNAASGNAAINVSAGSHTIATSVALNDTTVVDVVAGGTLIISGDINSNNGAGLTKSGLGQLNLARVTTNAVSLTGGTTQLIPNGGGGGLVESTALTVSTGATLDVTNNAVKINYSGLSPLADIKAKIAAGFTAGAWTGTGIASSSAASVAASTTNFNKTGIGYAEASSLTSVPGIFGGTDSDTLLFRYTLFGDANLDGTVNGDDFTALATNYNGTAKDWVQGDFNYDGVVNALDFNAIASNFGAPLASPPALGALVPEPISVSLLGLGAWAMRRRRHADV